MPSPGKLFIAAIEAILMIDPPADILGSACLHIRNCPLKLTFMMLSIMSSVASLSGNTFPIPALLIRISICSMSVIPACILASSLTSTLRNSTSKSGLFCPKTMTLAHLLRKSCAVALPMPVLAPVMMTVLLMRSMDVWISE